MPLYEYECDACGQRFEIIQKFSDPHADTCASCGKGPVRRLLSSPAIQFKGSGWYITDYAQKGKSDGKSEGMSESKPSSGNASDTTAKSDTSDAKTEKKADSGASSPPPSAAKP